MLPIPASRKASPSLPHDCGRRIISDRSSRDRNAHPVNFFAPAGGCVSRRHLAAYFVLKTPRLIHLAIALAFALVATVPARIFAADDSRTAVSVECECPDPVGAGFCAAFKEKVAESPRLPPRP